MLMIGSASDRAQANSKRAAAPPHAQGPAQPRLGEAARIAAVADSAAHEHLAHPIAAETAHPHHDHVGAQANATLATQLEHMLDVLHHNNGDMPRLPVTEAADAQALEPVSLHAGAARRRALQQAQQGFIIPLTLRRPRRIAYTEQSAPGVDTDWDVEAIESVIGTLHVSARGSMQTHDDPAMRQERRFRRWLVVLAHRRRTRQARARAQQA
jgi:hypothetical protein